MQVLQALVFASSLLSLISPWSVSNVVRCRRSVLKYAPPPPPTPPPPPPRRRHSDPHTHATTPPSRRYSDINKPTSKIDLRQELQNLMSNREVDKWLGNKFEEKEESYQNMFAHDLPLQRTLSLDGGIDIFKHLQTIGSDWTMSSEGSSWTVDSEERLNLVEYYKSLEDIPASQMRVKSRRASSEVDYATAGKSLALMVLKESYKGLDAGGTQMKKLQRCYTVSGTFESFKEAMKNSGDNLSGNMSPIGRVASGFKVETGTVYPRRSLRRSFSLRDAADIFEVQNYSVQDDDNDYLEIRVPSYRNISIDTKEQDVDQPITRQRRFGVFDPSFQGIKRETSLRREVMIKNVECKSCENISMRNDSISRSGSSSKVDLTYTTQKISLKRNTSSLSIRHTFSFGGSSIRDRVVPTIVVSDVDTPVDSGVAKKDNVIPTDTSNSVELSRICDCHICMDVSEVKRCNVRRIFSKMLVNIITCREYGRKLTYWDENNNLNENEMYKCIMNILKLMFGLWLRHLDHN